MFRRYSNSISVNIKPPNPAICSYNRKLNNRGSVEANNRNNTFLTFFTQKTRLIIYLLIVNRNNCFL